MNKKQENNWVNLMDMFDRDKFTAKFKVINDLAKFKYKNKLPCDIDCPACLSEFIKKDKRGRIKAEQLTEGRR